METKSLPVDLLRIDAGTQSRLAINEEVVEDYSEIVEGSKQWPFDEIDVFHDGSDYLVADGFHRTLGAKRAKRASIPCRVHKGTAIDARIFGMTANDRHGLRMSRADKRSCVEWLLDNQPKMTQADVAEKSGVNPRTVRRIVADRKPSVLDKNRTLSYSSDKVDDSISEKGRSGGEVSTSSATTPASTAPEPGEAADLPLDFDPFGFDSRGEDERTDTQGNEAQGTDPRPPRSGKDKPGTGTCPCCTGKKWVQDEFGFTCAKCHHPWGEVADVQIEEQKDHVGTLRSKTVKTVEALMRAFGDLNQLCPKAGTHKTAIDLCKTLLKSAQSWK
jgi:hypothetical protein